MSKIDMVGYIASVGCLVCSVINAALYRWEVVQVFLLCAIFLWIVSSHNPEGRDEKDC